MSDTRGRRDRHDIVAEILLNARGGAIKTHIMYKAKLSYGQLTEYLPMLVERGFLENRQLLSIGKRSVFSGPPRKGRGS